MSVEARTWTLDADEFHYPTVNGPNVGRGAAVKVIELEPVLDLLERAYTQESEPPADSMIAFGEIGNLLRTHGRLK